MLSSDEISDANAIVVCRHCRVSGGQTFPPDLSLCLIALVRLCQIVVPDILIGGGGGASVRWGRRITAMPVVVVAAINDAAVPWEEKRIFLIFLYYDVGGRITTSRESADSICVGSQTGGRWGGHAVVGVSRVSSQNPTKTRAVLLLVQKLLLSSFWVECHLLRSEFPLASLKLFLLSNT
jgi:hypothetical protein